MTWNLQRGQAMAGRVAAADMAPIAARILALRADVVGLQEVTRDQATALSGLLGWGSPHYAETKVPCPTFESPLPAGCVPFGNAILARQPLSEPAQWQLPPSTGEVGIENRILLRSVVVTAGDGVPVTVYATHVASDATPAEKEAQMAAVIGRIDDDRRMSSGRFRPVLLGDFNAGPDSDTIALLEDRFADAWLETAGDAAGFTSSSTLGLTRRVDYVFVGRASGLRVTAATVDTEVLSDHLAVVAEVALED